MAKKHILVIGQNPGNKKHVFGKSVNITLNRVNRWLTYLDVNFFSFANIIVAHNKNVSLKNVDSNCWMCYIDFNETIILCLGNFASNVLKRMKIDHFKLPHPSGLNRLLNDKSFEIDCLNECKDYIRRKNIK